jgi:hypothetical protein
MPVLIEEITESNVQSAETVTPLPANDNSADLSNHLKIQSYIEPVVEKKETKDEGLNQKSGFNSIVSSLPRYRTE